MQKKTQVSDFSLKNSNPPAHSSCAALPAWADLLGDCPAWRTALLPVLNSNVGRQLHSFLSGEERFYPSQNNLFAALRLTPLDQVRVVILGQDPYHGEGQAHGLSFSVPDGVKAPPSLRNIYKEISASYDGAPIPASGNLTHWATQGVLLLNTVLSVRPEQAASHQNRGWESVTDAAIRTVSEQCPHVVFMLWGSHAQKKKALIDSAKHLVLEAPHPSPLSAHRGFLGCGHFTTANAYLERMGLAPVDWLAPRS